MNLATIRERLRQFASSPLAEWLFNVIFASMPIWLGAIILWAHGEVTHSKKDWADSLLGTMARGELLLFCATFLAPAFWMVSFDRDGAKHFPYRTLWVAALLVVWVVASSVFGVWRSAAYVDETYSVIVYFSIGLALLAVLLRLGVILTNFYREPKISEATLNEDTNAFAENYAQGRSPNGN
jgi:hypothetical protein